MFSPNIKGSDKANTQLFSRLECRAIYRSNKHKKKVVGMNHISLFAKQAILFSSCFFLQMQRLFFFFFTFKFSVCFLVPDSIWAGLKRDLQRLLNSRVTDEPTNQNGRKPFLYQVGIRLIWKFSVEWNKPRIERKSIFEMSLNESTFAFIKCRDMLPPVLLYPFV